MAGQRKLGRTTSQRKAMLKGLVTALLEHGRIQTTEARAKEVKSIADKLISMASKETENVTTREKKVSKAKKDAKGKKIMISKESKNGKKYEVVQREITMETVTVDEPSRLHARRQCINWVYKREDKDGKKIVDKLFDDIAPKYKDRTGGFTRIYKMGPRRGDAAEVAILELV